MSEACVTNNAESVKPRIDESLEDSTEAISRMEDGNTPVGGPLVSAEVNSRSEVFYRRKCEIREKRSSWRPDVGAYGWVGNVHQQDDSDPQVAGCDVSESKGGRICFCEIWRFSRWHRLRAGIVADSATSWMNGNVGQQRLHATEQRVSSAGE